HGDLLYLLSLPGTSNHRVWPRTTDGRPRTGLQFVLTRNRSAGRIPIASLGFHCLRGHRPWTARPGAKRGQAPLPEGCSAQRCLTPFRTRPGPRSAGAGPADPRACPSRGRLSSPRHGRSAWFEKAQAPLPERPRRFEPCQHPDPLLRRTNESRALSVRVVPWMTLLTLCLALAGCTSSGKKAPVAP